MLIHADVSSLYASGNIELFFEPDIQVIEHTTSDGWTWLGFSCARSLPPSACFHALKFNTSFCIPHLLYPFSMLRSHKETDRDSHRMEELMPQQIRPRQLCWHRCCDVSPLPLALSLPCPFAACPFNAQLISPCSPGFNRVIIKTFSLSL